MLSIGGRGRGETPDYLCLVANWRAMGRDGIGKRFGVSPTSEYNCRVGYNDHATPSDIVIDLNSDLQQGVRIS